MAWYLPGSDYVKKRACRYLLQHYLGQFLKEKLTLDQLSVDLYEGKGVIKKIELDVQAVNESLENAGIPLEVLDGYVEEIAVCIPWKALISNSTEMEIQGLELTIQPQTRNLHVNQGLEAMLSSMSSSMSTSLQIAEDCFKSEEKLGPGDSKESKQYEGVKKFAQTIDSVLSRVKVTLLNTVIRLEYLKQASETGVALELHIKRLEYFDDLAEGSPVDNPDGHSIFEPAAFAHKNFHMEGIEIFLDEFSRSSSPGENNPYSASCSPDVFTSAVDTSLSQNFDMEKSLMPDEMNTTSNPLKIAMLTGKSCLKLKIKQNDCMTGPKLEVESMLGALHLLMCPRQVHKAVELASGMLSPSTNDGQSRKSKGNKSRPLSDDDMRFVETDLQHQMLSGRLKHQQQIQQQFVGAQMHDIMTQSMEGEDLFFALGNKDKHSDMDSSFTSISSMRTTSTFGGGHHANNSSRKSHSKQKDTVDDTSADISRYYLKIPFFSLCLLHENPSPPMVKSNSSDKNNSMSAIANEYFKHVLGFSGAGNKDLKQSRLFFAEALNVDHLRFVGKPLTLDCNEKFQRAKSTVSLETTVGMMEVVECLFDRRNSNTKPDFTELLVFSQDGSLPSNTQMYSSMHGGKPCFKASISTTTFLKEAQKLGNIPRMDISVALGSLETEIDITLVDRINSVFSPEPVRRNFPPSNMSSTLTQMTATNTFSQAMEEGPGSQDKKIDINISSPSIKAFVRFPIPDLRQGSQVDKLPWWQKNLRDEILVLDLSSCLLQTSFMTSQSLQHIEFSCKKVLASFRIDPNQEPVEFAYACGEEDEDGFSAPSFGLKIFNKTKSVLEEDNLESLESPPLDSLNGACQFLKKEPSPFSNRKHMYDKGGTNTDDALISEELVLPGDRAEMLEFQEKAMANTQMIMEFSLPFLNLILPDRHFYEVLYNRINSDLLLWVPMAPSPIQTKDSIGSVPFDLSCCPNAFNTGFQMAKSALKSIDSSDEDEDDDCSGAFYSIHDSRYPRNRHKNNNLPSKLCLLLKIDKGKVAVSTNSSEPNTRGELLCFLEDAMLFTVADYKGDPSLQYVCFQSSNATMYHSGCEKEKLGPLGTTADDICRIPQHMKKWKTIYKASDRAKGGHASDISIDKCNSDMVSVAVKVKLDSQCLNDLTSDEKIKEFLVAVGITGGTLQHRMVKSDLSWVLQVIDFLDVKDYDIIGYTPAKVLTELHIHLWNCAVDYRPLHIPTKALLAAESFSISSNIVAESPSSLLRFVLEDANLYLSQKPAPKVSNLSKDYVCVADLEQFELSLRFSDGKDSRFPKTDFKINSNRINLRTCADSCQALLDLLTYFANDGDLLESSEVDVQADEDMKNISGGDEELEDADDNNIAGLSESKIEHIENQVAEAMLESSSSESSPEREVSQRKATEVFFTTEKSNSPSTFPKAGNLRPIVISDSTDSIASSVSERNENLSEDEDFCIIDSPGLGITPRNNIPVIRTYVDNIEIKENYFSMPLGRIDLLKSPEHYPAAENRYTLKDLTLVWYMYGGHDFGPKVSADKMHDKQMISFSKNNDSESSVTMGYTTRESVAKEMKLRTPWQHCGGPGRDLNTGMELHLSKVQLQHECYPIHTRQASRQILIIKDVEFLDKVSTSNINKFLYQFSSEKMPKQSHANMVYIRAVHSRPDPTVATEECALKVSIQPIRLNIDQDSLSFLRKFFMEIAGKENDIVQRSDATSGRPRSATGASPQSPVITVASQDNLEEEGDPQQLLMMFDEVQTNQLTGEVIPKQETPERRPSSASSTPEHHAKAQPDDSELPPVFFKSFIFSPDVPIRLDYHGKSRVDRQHGTVAGLLVGLAQLNCSELTLKQINHQKGLLGVDKLLQFCANMWLNDIKNNQLPSILGGVGPMHSFVQLAQGIRDLFWLPVEQYRKDGRIVRGLQRGATSFTTSTAMAFLELTNKIVQSIQFVAEFTFDMVSPGPSVRRKVRHRRKKYGRPGQPSDIREGVSNAYIVFKEGFNDTAQNIIKVATKEHEQKGYAGAVGGVMRQIPPTVISPLIIASEATSNVLGGIRNQIKPEAKKEEEEKWKENLT